MTLRPLYARFIEAMELDPVGLVGNDGLCAALDDLARKSSRHKLDRR